MPSPHCGRARPPVNTLLFLASSHAFGDRRWSVLPVLGWGFGLLLHGAAVRLFGAGSRWREQLVQRERERLLRRASGQDR